MSTRPANGEGFDLVGPADSPAPHPDQSLTTPIETPDEEIDGAKLNRVLERLALRGSYAVRSLRMPGVPIAETDAWILRKDELRDLVPMLEGGARSAGVAAGLVNHGPMIVAGIAAMTFITRSVQAERPYRKTEPADEYDPGDTQSGRSIDRQNERAPEEPAAASGGPDIAGLAARFRDGGTG